MVHPLVVGVIVAETPHASDERKGDELLHSQSTTNDDPIGESKAEDYS